jgi:hypothetical protein
MDRIDRLNANKPSRSVSARPHRQRVKHHLLPPPSQTLAKAVSQLCRLIVSRPSTPQTLLRLPPR